MKLLVCFGTRPEAIKMAPIVHELKMKGLSHKICITAQHREMLDQVMEFFKIIPDYDLDVMRGSQSLNGLGSSILLGIDDIFEQESPDIVLVHGDTSSSLFIALAAYHKGIKVGHVEAGLRTYNKRAPFPEEINRQLTSRIADYHFAPTETAALNLLHEQIPKEQILVSGNTIIDAMEWGKKISRLQGLKDIISKFETILSSSKKIILVTGHRRENFGEGIKNLCQALKELSCVANVEIIYPVHLNPEVKEPVKQYLGEIRNIHLIDPVSYPEMLWLLEICSLIISDSGGIQEEAPSFNKLVLVTREFSERMEGVEAGFSKLVGTDIVKIKREAIKALNHPPDLINIKNPYGDGEAAVKIVKFLKMLE